MSLQSSNNSVQRRYRHNVRRQGFTLVELLISMTILAVILGIAGAALSSSMQVKGREMQLVEVQQNLRSALQLITQDIRAGTFMHLWNTNDCKDGVCSNAERIAIVTTDGLMSMIPAQPGQSYSAAKGTNVCDAHKFRKGDLALVSTGEGSAKLVAVTNVTLRANYDEPCREPPGLVVKIGAEGGNSDLIGHSDDKLSGSWSTSNHIFRAVLATYSLEPNPDPEDKDITVLFRRTGMKEKQAQSGVVAFNVTDLQFAYGIPADPDATASQLIFYPTLEEATMTLGTDYSAVMGPAWGKADQKYIGSVIQAVRVSITGRTDRPIDNDGNFGEFTLTETVGFRR